MRHTINFTIPPDGERDKGKVFVITEMPARQAESWAMRAILALMAGNVQLPEGFEHLGMAGMAELGLRALTGLKMEVVEPLMDEMLTCVQFMPDSKKPLIVRALIDEDVEEILTYVKLRAEVWKLHTGFLKAGALSTLQDTLAPAGKRATRNT